MVRDISGSEKAQITVFLTFFIKKSRFLSEVVNACRYLVQVGHCAIRRGGGLKDDDESPRWVHDHVLYRN